MAAPHPAFVPEIGERFGRLVVVDTSLRAPGSKPGTKGPRRFLCRCDCGTEATFAPQSLKRGDAKSCGCLRRELGVARGQASRRHGLWRHPLFKTWDGMVRRCGDPQNPAFLRYGGRGITVYELWRESPENFIAWVEQHLGPRPDGFSLDRVNNDGNYEPGNLRWADYKTQNNNRRPVSRNRWTKQEATA